jgi:PPOX class probable F420-dependent enzyme
MALTHELTDPMRAFLQEVRFAVIATVSPHGTPQQTVNWYLVEGDEIMFNTRRGRIKDRNLSRNQHVSICIEDHYRYITIRGQVQIIEDQATAQADIKRLAIRNHGREKGEQMAATGFSKEERIS